MMVLVAEDDSHMQELIRTYLELEGFEVMIAKDGEMALKLFESHSFDAVILDVMMPKIDGWTVCRRIREQALVPIIMVTARGEEYDKLFGFELGVEDYVVKPFSPKELMARLKVALRRHTTQIVEDAGMHSYQYLGLMIDYSARRVVVDQQPIKLTPKEYELLVYLVKNKNIALNRSQILSGVWGYDFYGDDRTVDTHIKMLRDRIGPYKDRIITVWGIGYQWHERLETQ